MSLFSEETLFFIFYSMPKDALQATAAAELCVAHELITYV
jgi:CCR4-NOT transcriptional regulation complex NOT5 subunit